VFADGTPAGEERLRFVAEASSQLRQKDRQRYHALRDQGSIRDVDIDAVIMIMVIGLGCLSSAKIAIRQLVGVDLDDESQRKRMVEGVSDLLLNGLLPR
jgi:hypothetical protein